MLPGISPQSLASVIPDATGAMARFESALTLCAKAFGHSVEGELIRFRRFHDLLVQNATAEPTLTPDAIKLGVIRSIGQGLPVAYRVTLHAQQRGWSSYSYQTQGRAAATVPRSLEDLTRAVLTTYLEAGGTSPEVLVESLAQAFPNVAGLSAYGRTAAPMGVTLTPSQESLHLDATFNTRMLIDGAHAQRVEALGAARGIEGERVARAYRALYGDDRATRFVGVRVPVHSPTAFALLVHVDRAQALDVLGQVAGELGCPVGAPSHEGALQPSDLIDEVGLTVELHPTGSTRVVWRTFIDPGVPKPQVLEATKSWLQGQGLDAVLPCSLIDALAVPNGRAPFPLVELAVAVTEGEPNLGLTLAPGH